MVIDTLEGPRSLWGMVATSANNGNWLIDHGTKMDGTSKRGSISAFLLLFSLKEWNKPGLHNLPNEFAIIVECLNFYLFDLFVHCTAELS